MASSSNLVDAVSLSFKPATPKDVGLSLDFSRPAGQPSFQDMVRDSMRSAGREADVQPRSQADKPTAQARREEPARARTEAHGRKDDRASDSAADSRARDSQSADKTRSSASQGQADGAPTDTAAGNGRQTADTPEEAGAAVGAGEPSVSEEAELASQEESALALEGEGEALLQADENADEAMQAGAATETETAGESLQGLAVGQNAAALNTEARGKSGTATENMNSLTGQAKAALAPGMQAPQNGAASSEGEGGAGSGSGSDNPSRLGAVLAALGGEKQAARTAGFERMLAGAGREGGVAALGATVVNGQISSPGAATLSPFQNLPGASLGGGAFTTIQAPVGSPMFGNELVAQMAVMAGRNLKSAQMLLNPAELGPIEVKLVMNKDQANIQIQAANPTVRDLVEGSQQRLRDMLANQGIELGQFDVGARQQQRDSGAQGNEQSGQEAAGSGDSGTGLAAEQAEEVVSRTLVGIRQLVDYYA